MFLAITPTSATSKILVMFNAKVFASRATSGHFWVLQVLRDSTVVFAPWKNNGTGNIDFGFTLSGVTNISGFRHTPLLSFLDTPSTTNEITYKLQFANYLSTTTPVVIINPTNTISSIILMEIAQ
jgi:hypothetical protein